MKQQQQTTEIIRAAAHRAMMNDSDLATMAGIKRSTLCDWLKHPSEFRLGALIDAANAVGMTDDEWIALRRGK